MNLELKDFQNLMNCLTVLINSNNSAIKVNAFYELFRQEPQFLLEYQDEILKIAKEKQAAKSAQGTKDIAKKPKKNASSKLDTTKENWWYCQQNKYRQDCTNPNCQEKRPIWQKEEVIVELTSKTGYHINCAPERSKTIENKTWQKHVQEQERSKPDNSLFEECQAVEDYENW